jgi:hypothetical protein
MPHKGVIMKTTTAAILCLTLNGCAHNLDLISRTGGPNGSGTAQELGKQITINLDGKQYKGTYIYDGGAVISTNSTATARAYSGSRSATAYGTGVSNTYIPGTGNGRILATSGSDSIRCDFNYGKGTGIGYCQDNAGNEFDLLIR